MVLEGLSGMFGFSGKAGWLQDAVINHRPKILMRQRRRWLSVQAC